MFGKALHITMYCVCRSISYPDLLECVSPYLLNMGLSAGAVPVAHVVM